jgi:VIT1/CCC1 family predicted Fe2+/Mn2+ transporter/rubrerythrin
VAAQEPEIDASLASAAPAIASTSRTNQNLWIAFMEEAKAKSVYQAYAMRAMEEGKPEVAEVFLEVGGAETAHALRMLQVLGEVGSSYENLQRVIAEEMRESSLMYPRMIRQAELDGRPDAAAAFRLAFEGESRHARRFQQVIDQLRSSPSQLAPAPIIAPVPAPIAAVSAPTPSVTYEKVQSEKQRVAGLRRIRELVFGAQDGLISSVAIAATVMAATGESGIAVIAGLASACAGTISMAAGTYLGARATSEMEESELEMERDELIGKPDEERAEMVATYRHDGYTLEEAERMADQLMENRERALEVMAERELGITPEAPPEPKKDAMVMGASYVVGGVLPILPYIVLGGMSAIPVSIGLTLVALAGIGIVKARTVQRPVLPSVLQVTVVGAASGILGYLLGEVLPRLFGVK